jgi:molybdopterin-guanine dinucleotide biosynthesis protein A
VLGVILCGGHSSRFGRDKARVAVDGRPLIAAVAAALTPVCQRIVAVADCAGKYADLGLDTLADQRPHGGPVGGLSTVLGVVSEPWLLLVPCDLVRPSPAWFTPLLAAARAGTRAVAVHDGRWQPLPCLLDRQACAGLTLDHGGSLHGVLDRLAATRLARPAGWPERLSANTQAELDTLLAP